MKSQILLLAFIVAVLSSCTTAYKTGQTPDDVYFSPAQPHDEYAQVEKKDNRRYEGRDEYYDDRYLRMRVSNRQRWSELDDWYYYGGRYDYSYYNVHNLYNPWTPCGYWNAYYNPYYPGYAVVKPKPRAFSGPRFTNLNTYNNNLLLTNQNYSNPKPSKGVRVFGSPGNNTQSGRSNSNYTRGADRNSGNFLRNVFNNNNDNRPSSNNNNNSNNNSGRSNTSSGSSNSGSSGGGSAPVRRF